MPKGTPVQFDSYFAIRVDKKDITTFKNKNRDVGKSFSSLIREIVKAFNENKLRIILTNEQRKNLKTFEKNMEIYQE